MSAYLDQLNGKSYGGICQNKIEILAAQEAHLWADIVDGKFMSAVNPFAGGNGWQDFHFVHETARFNEEPKIVGGSEFFRSRVTGIVSGDIEERFGPLHLASRKAWIVKFTDMNGIVKIVGLPRAGLVMRFESRDSKSKMKDRAEFNIIFEQTAENRAAQYDF